MSELKVVLADGSQRPLNDFFWPHLLLMLASLLLCLSVFLPFWSIKMNAPQFPDGLKAVLYIDRVEGHVQEIDGLNHYLGMPPLDEGGKLERKVSLGAVGLMSLLILGTLFVHNRWAGAMGVPALVFPWVFLADLQLILYRYGHSVDPESALGGAIKPFTPPVIGVGKIGQFITEASFGAGFYLSLAAAGCVLAGLWMHRRIYREVALARRRAGVP
ncbi:MAG: cytochrome C [Candidatus Eremiobacteraeota bacterium]|nr:cytochrome C [Candidatus Eremiobacteraeota bacterium]MCW5869898.1 cytochrome C [Candidatus Eremiobacteraeota bacterium]